MADQNVNFANDRTAIRFLPGGNRGVAETPQWKLSIGRGGKDFFFNCAMVDEMEFVTPGAKSRLRPPARRRVRGLPGREGRGGKLLFRKKLCTLCLANVLSWPG